MRSEFLILVWATLWHSCCDAGATFVNNDTCACFRPFDLSAPGTGAAVSVYFVSIDSRSARPTAFVGADDLITLRLLGSVRPAPTAGVGSSTYETQLYVQSAGVLKSVHMPKLFCKPIFVHVPSPNVFHASTTSSTGVSEVQAKSGILILSYQFGLPPPQVVILFSVSVLFIAINKKEFTKTFFLP